jgi:TolB-like protein/Tfp pilus assembly protein PilF
MAENEEATVHTLTAYREVMSSLIQQFRGRVVDTPGDNLLAEFASVVDAVQCAVEIQRVLRAKNAELAENRRMEFRIGVNLGDVIEEGDRIYGDGVNIAARIEGLAEPGGICISGTAYEHIENKLPLRYDDLGEHTVKNIHKPIRVYRAQMEFEAAAAVSKKKILGLKRWKWAAPIIAAIIIVGAGAITIYTYLWRPTAPPSEVASVKKLPFPLPIEPSIAVMPFENLSGDPKQEFIVDGLSENIIARLSKIPEMIVSARNSTFAYKGKHVKVQQIGKELGVRHVLEGSVLKSGNRLRVTAQLVDGIKGQHLWTEQYEWEIKDLLDLIDEITDEIVLELRVKLLDGESLRMLAKGTANPEAWRYVSQGLNAPFTKEGNLKAREFLDKAVEIDPKYSAAWALLALTYIMDVEAGWTDTKDKSYRKALQFTQKALELNNSNPLAHALLGAFHRGKGQLGKAIAEGEKAINLGPNHSTVHSIVAMIYFDAGRPEETIKLAKKAMHLAPYYDPLNLIILGLAYHKAGRYEEALETFKQALKLIRIGEYLDHFAFLGITLTCVELGRDYEARAYAAELFKIRPNLSLSAAANVMHFYKDHNDLKRFWNTLRKTGIVPPIVSSAQEFRYKGMPAFSIMYPKGRTEKESFDPKRVFKAETYEGLIELYAYVEGVPKGIELEDVGPKTLAPDIEKKHNAKIEVLSNEEIELADGTRAYKTTMEWSHRKGFLITTLLVSAFKEHKWVWIAAITIGDPREIEELAESLRFISFDIPIKGAIQHIRGPKKNISYTYIDIFIGEEFTGKLPDDIETIQVTGPSGDLTISKKDFRWAADLNIFWIGMIGRPELGTYTIEVTAKSISGSATDTQSVVRNLPIPDTNTFSPAKGAILTSKTPKFSWGPVKTDVPVYYMLEILDTQENVVYWGGYVEGMVSFTLPVGILLPGKSYIWRVRVGDSHADSHDWIKLQNVAVSERMSFTMAQLLE